MAFWLAGRNNKEVVGGVEDGVGEDVGVVGGGYGGAVNEEAPVVECVADALEGEGEPLADGD
jgi:hypothetical protein